MSAHWDRDQIGWSILSILRDLVLSGPTSRAFDNRILFGRSRIDTKRLIEREWTASKFDVPAFGGFVDLTRNFRDRIPFNPPHLQRPHSRGNSSWVEQAQPIIAALRACIQCPFTLLPIASPGVVSIDGWHAPCLPGIDVCSTVAMIHLTC